MTDKTVWWQTLFCMWKKQKQNLFYFYFDLTSTHPPREAGGPTGATSGPARRPVCQSYSRGFECAVTGANLWRPAITVSPSRRSEATLAAALNRYKHLKLSDSSGITMELLHFGESWNVSPTFFVVDLWVLRWRDNPGFLVCVCVTFTFAVTWFMHEASDAFGHQTVQLLSLCAAVIIFTRSSNLFQISVFFFG